METKATVESLFIYPLKGAKAIALKDMEITETGPRWDREWMLIDEKNDFLTQRKKSQLCLIEQQIIGNKLRLRAPSMEPIDIPMDEYTDENLEITIFGEKAQGLHVSSLFDQWFSDYFKQPIQLIRSPQQKRRQTSKKHYKKDQDIHFADGYPFLLTSMATLEELNTRLSSPVSMNRFRPNIVIAGAPADQEDQWKSYKIGNVLFSSVKACSRCNVITVEQESGVKNLEPLQKLAEYRMQDGKILFGQNLIHENRGQISIGDALEEII